MTRTRTAVLALALTSTGLVAAACGDDSGSSDTTAAVSSEAPTTDAPTTDAPSTEAPSTDAPTTDAPSTEAPSTEAPSTEAPSTEAPSIGTIVDILNEDGGFQTLLALIETAGATETLGGEVPYTLLAPNDKAFDALGQDAVDALFTDPDQALLIVRNHILPLPEDADLITGMNNLLTIDNASLDVVVRGDNITIAGAKVVTADIAADNGLIHEVDAVILPAAQPAS